MAQDVKETGTHAVDRIAGFGSRIAVILPCYNEAGAIATTVAAFRRSLPCARIFVFDNNSSDATAERALAAGAIVRHEPRQGKGEVVRRMLADVDADVYVLSDGDDTYDAAAAPAMVEALLDQGVDMVTGIRRTSGQDAAYRRGHALGNRLISGTVAALFRQPIGDMLSGYRVMSRRYAKSFPTRSTGFEIETDMTVHALEMRMKTLEMPVAYKERPPGTASKLSTWRDGLKIGRKILSLLRSERPFAFFGSIFLAFAAASLLMALPVFVEFAETGLVPRLPTAVAAVGAMLLAFIFLTIAILSHNALQTRREMLRLAYLNHAPPCWPEPEGGAGSH